MAADRYDVYISYAPQDGDWVRGLLLAALDRTGIRWCSTDTFPLGLPRLEAAARAVEASHRVVLVVSPAYLADHEQGIVSLLAQHYGTEHATWPVLPLIVTPVANLPLRLRLLNPLDATDREARTDAVARLCAELGRPLEPPTAAPTCPYPGMRPFNPAEASVFHGREDEISEGMRHLRLNRWLVVIGASGSGKSSLVLAGLAPRLAERGHEIVRWRPGQDPLSTLTRALPRTRRDHEVLFVADQVEELFVAPGTGPIMVARVWDLLEQAVADQRIRCVATLRADFYPQAMASPPLWETVRRHRLEVAPLDARRLREAITRPAEAAEVYVESALVERLASDAAGEPGVLPFVQETMVLLWEAIEYRYLPMSAYDALVIPHASYGQSPVTGLQVAMAARADAVLNALRSEAEQRIARRIFLRLVQFVDGRHDVRQQLRIDDLRSEDDDADLFRTVLDTLVGGHLLTTTATDASSEVLIDLSHESLIHGWPFLRELAARRRQAEHDRRQLEQAAVAWVARERGAVGLLDEVEVHEAEQWLGGVEAAEVGVGPNVAAFIRASRNAVDRAEARRRRTTRLLRALSATLAALLVIALGVAVDAVSQRDLARTAQREAQSGELATRASILPDIQLDRALLLGVEAVRLRSTPRSRAGLLTALQKNPRVQQVLTFAGPVDSLAATTDGRRLAVADDLTGATQVLDTSSWRQLGPELHAPSLVRRLAFSPDGSRLAATRRDGTTYEWVTGTDQVPDGHRQDHTGSVRALAYSRDGTWRATAGVDRTIVVVARTTGTVIRLVGHREWVNALAFSPDSRWLVSAGGAIQQASTDGRILVWDLLHTGRPPRQIPDQRTAVRALAVSRRGLLAAAGNDGAVRLWDLTTLAPDRVLAGHRDPVLDVAFSPDGSLLASAGRDGDVRVWDVATGVARGEPLRGHGAAVHAVVFLDDRTLVSGGDDAHAIVWSLDPSRRSRLRTALNDPPRPVRGLTINPTRTLVASGNDDGRSPSAPCPTYDHCAPFRPGATRSGAWRSRLTGNWRRRRGTATYRSGTRPAVRQWPAPCTPATSRPFSPSPRRAPTAGSWRAEGRRRRSDSGTGGWSHWPPRRKRTGKTSRRSHSGRPTGRCTPTAMTSGCGSGGPTRSHDGWRGSAWG